MHQDKLFGLFFGDQHADDCCSPAGRITVHIGHRATVDGENTNSTEKCLGRGVLGPGMPKNADDVDQISGLQQPGDRIISGDFQRGDLEARGNGQVGSLRLVDHIFQIQGKSFADTRANDLVLNFLGRGCNSIGHDVDRPLFDTEHLRCQFCVDIQIVYCDQHGNGARLGLRIGLVAAHYLTDSNSCNEPEAE